MVGKMPDRIKRNFVYRRIWNNVYEYDKEAVFLFIGDTGSGKSTGALLVGYDFDPGFNTERICFSVKELLNLIKNGDSRGKLKPGSVIIFDEAAGSEDAVDARNSLTETNKILSFFATISRAKRFVIIYVCPFLEQLDKRIRKIGLTGILAFRGTPNLTEKRSNAKIYWTVAHAMSGNVTNPHPVLKQKKSDDWIAIDRVTLPLPPRDLIKEYKAKKNAFINGKIDDWYKQLQARKDKKEQARRSYADMVKEVMDNLDNFKDAKGKITIATISGKLNVGDTTARIVRKNVENALAEI